jgi:serine/threonine-protein kinase RsbW
MQRLVLPAKIENLESMLEFITGHARALGFDDKSINQIQLASEELLVNVINYAYPDKNGEIEITCTPKQAKGLEVKIADSGIPFNPLSQPQPDTKSPLEKRNIGGLGIHLVRNMMDEVNYKRQEERNILIFIKNL